MVGKILHKYYIELYKELINEIIKKEIIIEDMTTYISKYARKVPKICENCKSIACTKCNYKQCEKSVREYFEITTESIKEEII